jgi:CubicO group peptidase (beta-lactamase class C family)
MVPCSVQANLTLLQLEWFESRVLVSYLKEDPTEMGNSSVTRSQVEAALPQLEQNVKEAMQRTGVPAISVTVVFQDEVMYLNGFGVCRVDESQPVDVDTVFQIASLSKPIASTIVAGVVGDKVVSWDDPNIKHDPGFQLDNPYVTQNVTLRDMFSHRSGLPDHAGDLLEDIGFDRKTILYRLRYLPTDNYFRSKYDYTNFGLTEAAIAVAKATGKTWEDLASQRLYQRLGMLHTSSRFADYEAASNRALLHVQENGQWVAKYTREPDAQTPAGGVSSTVRDLSQWLRLQLGNGKYAGEQVIDADALAETHRPQVFRVPPPPANPATDRAGLYGLGWNVDYNQQTANQLNHSGAFNLGAATTVRLLPSEQLGIVALTNAQPIGVPEAITRAFFDLVLYGKVQQDWIKLFGELFAITNTPPYGTTIDYTKPPAHPSPPLPFDAYVATYFNDFYGDIEVAVKPGGLVLELGPNKIQYPMGHYDGNIFYYQPTGENAYGLSGITFTIGGGEKATSVLVENLNVESPGIFTRK